MREARIIPVSYTHLTTLFSKDAALEALNKGKVIFFAGGTGHPYFSTDTGAVLRAIEIEADAMLLAKAIDGIYDSDPKVNPQAKKYDEISIQEIIDKKLMAVDLTAVSYTHLLQGPPRFSLSVPQCPLSSEEGLSLIHI